MGSIGVYGQDRGKETKARFSSRIFGDDPFAPGDTRARPSANHGADDSAAALGPGGTGLAGWFRGRLLVLLGLDWLAGWQIEVHRRADNIDLASKSSR